MEDFLIFERSEMLVFKVGLISKASVRLYTSSIHIRILQGFCGFIILIIPQYVVLSESLKR